MHVEPVRNDRCVSGDIERAMPNHVVCGVLRIAHVIAAVLASSPVGEIEGVVFPYEVLLGAPGRYRKAVAGRDACSVEKTLVASRYVVIIERARITDPEC